MKRTAVVILIILLLVLAWYHRFIQDDAFISFRYAKHLVEGKGLAWNEGEYVEGYTNFLWVLLCAAGIKVGINPVLWTQFLGLLLYSAVLILYYRLGRILLEKEKKFAVLLIILLGTNHSFLSYATGGMETPLVTFCLALALYLLFSRPPSQTHGTRWLLFSLVLGLGFLTRMDFLIFAAVLLVAAFLRVIRHGGRFRQYIPAALLPFCAAVCFLFLFRYFYYDEILPNSFYAKVPGSASLTQGFRYVILFFMSYQLIPFAPLVIWAWWKTRHYALTLIVPLLSIWFLYVIRVGGDFMEFRFIVPVIPLIYLGVILSLFSKGGLNKYRGLGSALVLILALWGLLMHPFKHEPLRWGVEGIDHLNRNAKGWSQIGRQLGEVLPPETRIAITAAGAIPYYSGLYTVDMHGLNDYYVARYGQIVNVRSGHQKCADLAYLSKQKVHLVIDHPGVERQAGTFGEMMALPGMRRLVLGSREYRNNACFVFVRLPGDRYLPAIYLTKDPVIDAAIEARGWPLCGPCADRE